MKTSVSFSVKRRNSIVFPVNKLGHWVLLFLVLFLAFSRDIENCDKLHVYHDCTTGPKRQSQCECLLHTLWTQKVSRAPTCADAPREMIAAKISNDVSRQRILDDIRKSASETFHRQHLLDRQDLANLERAFALQNVQRHDNDVESVLAWISEWTSDTGEENPVLYLKLQEEEAKDGYDLPTDDFTLKCYAKCYWNLESTESVARAHMALTDTTSS